MPPQVLDGLGHRALGWDLQNLPVEPFLQASEDPFRAIPTDTLLALGRLARDLPLDPVELADHGDGDLAPLRVGVAGF